MSTQSLYERSEAWMSKGRFWVKVGYAFLAANLASIPVQWAVADATWSWIIAGFAGVMLGCQIGVSVYAACCFRRAVKVYAR
jgi:hypothetical protein